MDFIFGKRAPKEGRNESNPTMDGKAQHETVADAGDSITSAPPSRTLAFKSGFVTLQERLSNLKKQSAASSKLENPKTGHSKNRGHSSQPQFATLQEFFQSKSSLRKQRELDEEYRRQKKPKVPIMKLSKDDWNVRCWEERLSAHRKRQGLTSRNRPECRENAVMDEGPNKGKKVERQVEVFHERINDVSMKLDKVREGTPLDDELHKLITNKSFKPQESSHTWTDLLKKELAQGTHNPSKLHSSIKFEAGHNEPNEREEVGHKKGRRPPPPPRSPMGRPIRRLSDYDEED